MHWMFVTFCVCCYGFVSELQPSEAYMSVFLNSTWKNLTIDEINGSVFPWWTYSCLAGFLGTSLLAEHVKHKSVLVYEGVLLTVSFVITIWLNGLTAMILAHVCKGLAYAGSVSFYTVLYPLVGEQHYNLVTSLTRAAPLLSKLTASLTGQLLLSYNVIDLKDMNIVSLISVSMSIFIALMIPMGTKNSSTNSVTPHQKPDPDNRNANEEQDTTSDGPKYKAENKQNISIVSDGKCFEIEGETSSFGNSETDISQAVDGGHICMGHVYHKGESSHDGVTRNDLPTGEMSASNAKGQRNDIVANENRFKYATSLLRQVATYVQQQFRSSYSSRKVLLWSSWSVLGTIGNYDRGKYTQNLWELISPFSDRSNDYNGAAKASAVLLGAVFVLAVGMVPINWSKPGRSELFMISMSALKAISYCVMSKTGNIWVAYALFDIVYIVIHMSLTVQCVEIAKTLPGQGYGFVYGCNMFGGLLIETVFTAVVVDSAGIGVGVRQQFFLYGLYYSLNASVFVAVGITTAIKRAQGSTKAMGTDKQLSPTSSEMAAERHICDDI